MTPDRTNQEESAAAVADDVIRLEDVQRVTESALAYLDLDDLLRELLDRVTDILEADTAAVLLVEEGGRTLAARAAKGLEEEVERGFRLPVGARLRGAGRLHPGAGGDRGPGRRRSNPSIRSSARRGSARCSASHSSSRAR